MDRNVVIATVLIMGILLIWMYVVTPPPSELQPVAPDTTQVVESIGVEEEPDVQGVTALPPAASDTTLDAASVGTERRITVDTDLYTAELSTEGATIVRFRLKDYAQFDQQTPIELVDTLGSGALGLEFQSPGGRNRDTRAFFFDTEHAGDRLQVGDAPVTLPLVTHVGDGAIRFTYTFTPGTYEIGLLIEQTQPETFRTDDGYEIVWNGAIPFSEDPTNRKEEATKIGAYARSGGEVEGVALQKDADEGKTLRGDVSWMAVKNKYFAAVVLTDKPAQEAELIGERIGELDEATLQVAFRASLFMDPRTAEPDVFRLYLGPLEYGEVSQYEGLYDMVDYGWNFFEWMTRPLATFIFIPTFSLLSSFIPNYGLVIILFGILIKLLLFPLTKSSYQSMAKMRDLQPKMMEIKEKFKDDPQKQQAATMKLYRESGTNPLGSCLPMLLQYPSIIALWQFLQQSIEIRQEGFLWANDLSAPDAILQLPFSIPFYGDYVAGFTVLMGLSLIVQMRMQATPATGAQAKIFMYVMPVFIFVIFNRLPSGLSLYYLCYNVITAVQQKFINNSLEKKKALEESATRKTAKGTPARNSSPGRRGSRKKGGRAKLARQK